MRFRADAPVVGLSVIFLLAATGAAQQPATQGGQPSTPAAQQPSFKSGTQVVEVDVRVFDKNGHFVSGLTSADFEIKEDGVAQPIVSLTLIGSSASPLPAPSSQLPAPGSQLPASGARPSAPSIWLFVFDTMHLSPGGLHNTQKAVEEFLRTKFHDGDIGGIVADGKMANNRLTSVREELVKAVTAIKLPNGTFQYQMEMTREWPRIQDEFEAWRIAVQNDASALQQAIIRACSDDPDACRGTPPDMAVRLKSQRIVTAARASTALSLRVVEALSNGLARMAGPKTVVYISEGFVLQDMEPALRDATGLANRAGAHFYTIDARGLNKGSVSSSIIDQPAAFDPAGPMNTFDMQADGTNALAVDTGGMAIRNENNFGRALDIIQQDTGTYYVLGYTPSNQKFDGKYRSISASVRRPDVKVRARRGYLAIEPAKLLKPVPISPSPGGGGKASSEPAAPAEPRKETPQPSAVTGGSSSTTASPAAPTAALASASETPPAATAAPESSASAASAASLRHRIESNGLVEELQNSAQRLAPTKTSDLAGQGWAAYQRGDLENAAVYLGKAAESPDAHPWVRYALGLAHLAVGRYREAVDAWEHVRHEVPEFEPVYFNLADGYLLQKDDDAALKVLRGAQAKWPDDSEVWNAGGVMEIRRGAIDAAVRSFTRATTVAPDDSLGFFNLARAYQMRAAQSQRFDSTLQKWVGGESDARKAIEYYTKYVQMGGPFVQQAKEALQVLNWKA
jgi:VWFA-related protein